MQSQIKICLCISFLLSWSGQNAAAQIFDTRSNIIKERGTNYTAATTDAGVRYILYVNKVKNPFGRIIEQARVYYFTTVKDKREICHMWKTIEPSSEANTRISELKQKFVELSETVWKDYENNILYTVEVKDGFFTLQVEFLPKQ